MSAGGGMILQEEAVVPSACIITGATQPAAKERECERSKEKVQVLEWVETEAKRIGRKNWECVPCGRAGIRNGLAPGHSARQPRPCWRSTNQLILGCSSGRKGLWPWLRRRCLACCRAAAGALAHAIQQAKQRGDAQLCHLCKAGVGGMLVYCIEHIELCDPSPRSPGSAKLPIFLSTPGALRDWFKLPCVKMLAPAPTDRKSVV